MRAEACGPERAEHVLDVCLVPPLDILETAQSAYAIVGEYQLAEIGNGHVLRRSIDIAARHLGQLLLEQVFSNGLVTGIDVLLAQNAVDAIADVPALAA